MKLLLYCTKAKPELYNTDKGFVLTDFGLGEYYNDKVLLNGKIVAECDFEVEKINVLDCSFRTFNLVEKEILNKSCLTYHELFEYLKNRYNPRGYAIHIKNLHIFKEPKELDEYYTTPKKINTFEWCGGKDYAWVCENIDKAPQNMMYATDDEDNDYVLISIKPQWLFKILNGEKTIEVRKKVLKDMIK